MGFDISPRIERFTELQPRIPLGATSCYKRQLGYLLRVVQARTIVPILYLAYII